MEAVQMSLKLDRLEPVRQPEWQGQTIQDRFDEFHALNPHVARRLAEMALQEKRRGWQWGSIDMLCHALRRDYRLQTTGDDFKINNNFTALYARLLMDQWPELQGFFETRKRRAK